MVHRIRPFAVAGACAWLAAACGGVSTNVPVEYDTATATVAALLSAVADRDQARVDALTTHSGTPASHDSVATVARAAGSPAASSTGADAFMDDPSTAMNDMAGLRRYFEQAGKLEHYAWDADAHALSLEFACAAQEGPRCVDRLYFTFDHELGGRARVDMMIGVRNNPAWAQLWADLPNARGLHAAAPAPAIAHALARFD
ncbi:hypothetical protein LF41_2906 [Lysobacter dokdonensis DS-58]|uniref:Lipoprotein n=1 Tax=Lysobacter dokdonensis DS-58 TaxID=1300345 RepID=A0A0A2WLW3_9GAMM|nr:hypothetical protein [Lysobacter dokdonensis]KGQ19260.1 hypothetical protein LF41_2906 [Lysobacter dokdonensis DS-58]